MRQRGVEEQLAKAGAGKDKVGAEGMGCRGGQVRIRYVKGVEEQLAKAEANKDKVCLEGGGMVERERTGGQVRDRAC